MIQPGAVLDLEVTKPAAGGRMLARHEGQVVLVWGAIPGERVSARVERVTKGVAFADVVGVTAASPDRRDVDGDWRCGGNVFAHVAYARQVQLKAEIVHDAFVRIARVPIAAPQVLPSPERGYRMRARLHASGTRLGFFREGTHDLCDVRRTGQLLDGTCEWVTTAQQTLERLRLNGLAGVEIAENVAGDARACHLELHAGVDPQPFAALADGLVGLSAQRVDVSTPVTLGGSPVITDEIALSEGDGGRGPVLRLQRDARAFFQGNRFILRAFVRHVIARVPAGPVVDLYAGVGLFGLALAASGCGQVTLVEGDPVSGGDLQRNAVPYRDVVRVERRSVEDYLRRVAAPRRGRPAAPAVEATYVVDPPRTGMSRDALGGIVHLAPSRIVYVSCDVATLARDTRALIDGGYELQEVSGVDLFPNTAHVECVAIFSRASRR